MTAFVITIHPDARDNSDRAKQAGLWDFTIRPTTLQINPGDHLYFWVTGGRRGDGLRGRATATTTAQALAPADPRPWVQPDPRTYLSRVLLTDFRDYDDKGITWGQVDVHAQAGRLNPVTRLNDDAERWLLRQVGGFNAVEVAAADLAEEFLEDPESELSAEEMAEDRRKRVLASIRIRQGQPKFRRALLEAYAGACAVTGTNVEELLDAAHIQPYRGEHTNDVRNGILLRTDIHTLFDRHLLTIVDGTVRLSDALRDTDYWVLQDRPFIIALPQHSPKKEYLEAHLAECDWLGTI